MTSVRKDIELLATHKLIDSRRLLYFYYVAKTGRLTAAETILNVAQSAISRQLQQLEQELDVQLFDRTGRGVRLTPYGEVLLKHAETILQSMSATVDALEAAALAPEFGLSIAGPPSYMAAYMPDAVLQFVKHYPKVRIRVLEASTGGVYSHLANGDVDLALIVDPTSQPRVILKKLAQEELSVIAAPKHAIAQKKSVSRTDLKGYAMVLPASLHGSRAVLKRYFDGDEIPLRSQLEVDSLPLTRELVKRTDACTILPAITCQDDIDAGRLIARPLRPALYRTVQVAHLKERPLTPEMEFLVQCISNALKASGR